MAIEGRYLETSCEDQQAVTFQSCTRLHQSPNILFLRFHYLYLFISFFSLSFPYVNLMAVSYDSDGRSRMKVCQR